MAQEHLMLRPMLRSMPRSMPRSMSKTRPNPLLRLGGLLSLLLCSGAAADVADDLHEQLKERWYTTEVVVFRYTNPPAAEALEHSGERMRADEKSTEYDEMEPLAEDGEADTDSSLTPEAIRRLQQTGKATVVDRDSSRPPLDVAPLEDIADSMSGGDLGSLVTQNMATWENQLREQDGQLLPEDQLALLKEAKKISSSRRTELLLHQAWTQAVPDRSNGQPVSVSAGDTFVDPRTGSIRNQLEGEITVTLGRYLHLQPTLFFTPDLTPEFSAADAANTTLQGSATRSTTAAGPTGRKPEVRDLSESGSLDGLSALDRLQARKRLALEQPTPLLAARSDLEAELPPYVRLDQSRRLRSGELHYIDHPEIGMLVLITPVVAPEKLQEQFTLLE